tara:strand:+ start:1123 stop:1299 length:177 start_codon:yes stop_codon:yes gene_type:complete
MLHRQGYGTFSFRFCLLRFGISVASVNNFFSIPISYLFLIDCAFQDSMSNCIGDIADK